MDIPAPLTYGTIIGRFITVVADSTDVGNDPDAVALTGTIEISPVLSQFRIVGPPTQIVISTAITANVVNGDLLAVGGIPLRVLASDSPGLDPTPIYYTAKFNLTGVKAQPATLTFAVPSGGTVDISGILPVPSDPSVQTFVSEATRIAAEAAATRAEVAADRAEAALAAMGG